MVVTDSGIVIEVKPELRKAELPMVSTESGIVIEVNLEQSRKAFEPMVSTELPK